MTNILEWLEASAERFPQKTAFADETQAITYRQLMARAQKIGKILDEKITPCTPVAFYLEKSCTAITGMMGAVYARGFYSVLDTRQPEARLHTIVGILDPQVILTDRENEEKARTLFAENKAELLVIEDLLGDAGEEPEDLVSGIRPDAQDVDPLYVNFTSGSTGTPKGVVVCHRSVLDFISCFTEIFDITDKDVIGNQAPFDFDVSVKDIFSGLRTGATVQIIPRGFFSAPMKLLDYLCDREVTTLVWAVSAMCFVSIMNGFDYKVPTKVRKVLFSGEVLPIKQLHVWKKYLPDATFVNLYGPTEITCNCTYHVLDREYELNETIHIGIPFPNEKVFLLNEEDRLVTEPGIPGELCAGGTCLALGYYKEPEKTAAVFTQNPLNKAYQEMIYRTGDLAKYDAEGKLLYISRKDFQVKHLGHRIELGEIETTVMSRDEVTRACCLYDNAKKRLVLFYTGGRDKKDLMKELKLLLPPFMLPNAYHPLDEMPMTKNGKIDRKQLKEIAGIA